MAGCRTNLDCPSDRTCVKGQCLDPCAKAGVCGKQALCKTSDHRVVCLCPDGYKGEPTKQCLLYECERNEDCDNDKKCDNGACKNMCLQSGACGVNAQCRVSNRNAQCSCPPGYFGNPRSECLPQVPGACARNPCGDNARCRDVVGGFECSCAPGCVGDPRKGCICGDHLMNVCANKQCGKNAACRVLNHDEPECYCPPEYPNGDPYSSCKIAIFFRLNVIVYLIIFFVIKTKQTKKKQVINSVTMLIVESVVVRLANVFVKATNSYADKVSGSIVSYRLTSTKS